MSNCTHSNFIIFSNATIEVSIYENFFPPELHQPKNVDIELTDIDRPFKKNPLITWKDSTTRTLDYLEVGLDPWTLFILQFQEVFPFFHYKQH